MVDLLRATAAAAPDGARIVEARAWLVNPDAAQEHVFSAVGEAAIARP
jgi:hypothetical protein